MNQIEITKADHITGLKTIIGRTRWGESRSVNVRALSYGEVRDASLSSKEGELAGNILSLAIGSDVILDELAIDFANELTRVAMILAGFDVKIPAGDGTTSAEADASKKPSA